MRKWLVLGGILCVLLLGGAAAALWKSRQERPTPYWVQISGNFPTDESQRKQLEESCRRFAESNEVLKPIAASLHLAETWKLGSEDEAVAQLRSRVYARLEGNLLLLGANGVKREAKTTQAISQKLSEAFMATQKKQAEAASF